MPYTSGGGSVTRRQRWVRRVWFDEERYKREIVDATCIFSKSLAFSNLIPR